MSTARNDASVNLTDDEFNQVFSSLLQDNQYSESKTKSPDSGYRKESELRQQVANIPSEPISDKEFYSNFKKDSIDVNDLVEYIGNPKTNPSVKTNAVIEAIQNPELQKALAARIKGTLSQSDDVIRGLVESLGVQKELMEKNIQLGLNSADQARKELLAKKERADAIAADTYNAVARFGTDLTNPQSLINKSAIQNAEEFQQTVELEKKIREKQSVSFLDNPGQFILNQFTVGSLIDQHNFLAASINKRNTFLDAQNHTVELAKQANAGKLSVMSTAEVDAQSQILLNNAQVQANNARAAMLQTQGKVAEEGLRISNTATDKLTGEQLRAQQMIATEESREAQRIQTKNQQIIMNEARDERLKIEREKQADKKKIAEEQAVIDKQIADALAPTGLPIKTQAQFNRLPKDVKETLIPLLSKPADGSLGTTPSEVLSIAKLSGPNLPSNDSQKIALKVMEKTRQDTIGKPDIEVKKPEEKKIEVDKAIASRFNSLQSNLAAKLPVGNVQWNPYSGVPILDALPWLPAGNEFVKTATAVSSALPKGIELNPGMVVQAMVQKVIKGELDPATAAGAIAEYAQKQVENNNKTSDFARFALPEQTTFKQDLPVISGGGVNLLNKTEVLKQLWKMRLIGAASFEIFAAPEKTVGEK